MEISRREGIPSLQSLCLGLLHYSLLHYLCAYPTLLNISTEAEDGTMKYI